MVSIFVMLSPDGTMAGLAVGASMRWSSCYWIVWRIGGQKSHPGFHRVRSFAGLMPTNSGKIKWWLQLRATDFNPVSVQRIVDEPTTPTLELRTTIAGIARDKPDSSNNENATRRRVRTAMGGGQRLATYVVAVTTGAASSAQPIAGRGKFPETPTSVSRKIALTPKMRTSVSLMAAGGSG
jgi:hypothetical protein